MAEPVAVVTGAAGFIGTHLVDELLADGRRVVGIDRRPMPDRVGLTGIVADLSEPDARVRAALDRAAVVFHLAGCPGVRERGPDIDRRRQRDNVDATARTLDLIPVATPVVVASSSSVYGGTSGAPCQEDRATRPRGGYARSKVEVERLCAARSGAGGVVAAARLFTVAGEGQRQDMAVSRWINDVAHGRRALVFGSLDRTRDVTDVRDVVTALRRLADVRAVGVVNVGTGTAHTLAQMLAAIGAALGRPVAIDVAPVRQDDPDATLADPARLAALTGVRPHTDLPALIQRQVHAAMRFSPLSDRSHR
jgi:nucleoside-diphosphate-sugar epimerase